MRVTHHLVCVLLVACISCATKLGPRTVPGTRFNYNEAIARSLNEQLLLNLVRLRYRDTPLFVDVGSVIAQYSLSGNIGATPTVGIDGSNNNEYGVGVGAAYSESPTITYEPLRGGAAAERLLAPINPTTLALLSQSGWSIERLMLCCVQEINGVDNAPSATGPAPTSLPDNRRFREVAAALRELQTSGALKVRPTPDGVALTLRDEPPSRAVRDMLDLDPALDRFRLVPSTGSRSPAEIELGGRSLLGVLFFLSLAVDTPESDRTAGLIGGSSLNWNEVIGGLLKIHSSESAPPRAFVRIRYRGRWFYIDDADLNSKATFNLLNYLHALQAAGAKGSSPLLTVPVR
jgi:hypothetical protein